MCIFQWKTLHFPCGKDCEEIAVALSPIHPQHQIMAIPCKTKSACPPYFWKHSQVCGIQRTHSWVILRIAIEWQDLWNPLCSVQSIQYQIQGRLGWPMVGKWKDPPYLVSNSCFNQCLTTFQAWWSCSQTMTDMRAYLIEHESNIIKPLLQLVVLMYLRNTHHLSPKLDTTAIKKWDLWTSDCIFHALAHSSRSNIESFHESSCHLLSRPKLKT